MSNMDTNESNSKSKDTISKIIEKGVNTTNGLGITDKHPSNNKMRLVITFKKSSTCKWIFDFNNIVKYIIIINCNKKCDTYYCNL